MALQCLSRRGMAMFIKAFLLHGNFYHSLSVAWPMFITGQSLSFLSVNKVGGLGCDILETNCIKGGKHETSYQMQSQTNWIVKL